MEKRDLPPGVDEADVSLARPRWHRPRFEVMPMSMVRNSHPLKPNDVTGGPAYS